VRLLVDGLFLRPGRVGGVEYMLYSLLTALTASRADDDRVRVLLPDGVDLSGRPFADDVEQVRVASPGNRFLAVERRLPPDDDAALFPNYYTPLAAVARRRPSVTVVHDLQFRAFPENFTPAKRAFQHLALRATCRLATRVVAISAFTAGELAAFQPGVRDRLEVVANPIDWSRFDVATPPPTAPELLVDPDAPLFVLAAAQYRHKNIATAIEAFARVHAHDPRARLVLVGQVPTLLGETRVGAALPEVPGVVQLGFVSDAVLSWLYRRATAVLLPSLYEGCGLPCAEAIGLGTPVIHSGRGALPEVAAGAGVAVGEPTSVAEWAQVLTRAASHRPAAVDPETAASVRAAHDPQDIGKRYWSVLRRAADPTG
jgi:glycosyltransferase involved in cell wall biosynthesis